MKRLPNGLIEGIEYSKDSNGYINWKSLIPSEFLYVNPNLKLRDKIEKKYNKSYSEINPIQDKVEDVDLIILLGGIKYLLKLRGFKEVNYTVNTSTENYASVTCSIKFIPNEETMSDVLPNYDITFSDNACAHFGNTNGFGQKYLLEMATNRSFCRTVRNFLNINIVSKEELGSTNNEDNSIQTVSVSSHTELLNSKLNSKKINFDYLKKNYPKFNKDWKELKDIDALNSFSILGWIQEEKIKN